MIEGQVAAVKSGMTGFCMPMRQVDGTWLADGMVPPFNPSSPDCSP